MRDIKEYIKDTREARRQHLDLSLQCNEYGGNGSTEFKGLLAYFLMTTIPCRGEGYKILLCHACGNPKCSNVKHLYWGTPKDNILDAKEHGTWKSQYERTLIKYGSDGMKQIASKAGKTAAQARSHQKPKDHWEKFREAFEAEDRTKRGWIKRLSNKFNISHTHIRRIAKQLNL
jgi:hypothetical protein